ALPGSVGKEESADGSGQVFSPGSPRDWRRNSRGDIRYSDPKTGEEKQPRERHEGDSATTAAECKFFPGFAGVRPRKIASGGGLSGQSVAPAHWSLSRRTE